MLYGCLAFNTKFQSACKNQNILENPAAVSHWHQVGFVPLCEMHISNKLSSARDVFHTLSQSPQRLKPAGTENQISLSTRNPRSERVSWRNNTFLFSFRSAKNVQNRIINFAINVQFPCSHKSCAVAAYSLYLRVLCVNLDFVFSKYAFYCIQNGASTAAEIEQSCDLWFAQLRGILTTECKASRKEVQSFGSLSKLA